MLCGWMCGAQYFDSDAQAYAQYSCNQCKTRRASWGGATTLKKFNADQAKRKAAEEEKAVHAAQWA